MKKETIKTSETYERPEIEIVNFILETPILDPTSGDGTVIGPGDEIPS